MLRHVALQPPLRHLPLCCHLHSLLQVPVMQEQDATADQLSICTINAPLARSWFRAQIHEARVAARRLR